MYNKHRPKAMYNKHRPKAMYNKHRPKAMYNKRRPKAMYNKHRPKAMYNKHRPKAMYNKHRHNQEFIPKYAKLYVLYTNNSLNGVTANSKRLKHIFISGKCETVSLLAMNANTSIMDRS
jgi:hypothetical protein